MKRFEVAEKVTGVFEEHGRDALRKNQVVISTIQLMEALSIYGKWCYEAGILEKEVEYHMPGYKARNFDDFLKQQEE